MKHVIIGTAGHVDHGKTLLIKALTGIDTDRLKEEKKRGITIELGFAHIEWEDGLQAGIVDVPGHEKFIRNMLAGAGGIDLAMLVVAADEGFMPQTVEHLDILTLLGIKDGLVVITKTDMVDAEWLSMMKEEIAQRIKGTFLENHPVMEVSAYTGEGIQELKAKLYELVQQAGEKSMRVPFRLPVDRVFSVEGFGTVVTGTLIEGCINEGDSAVLMPSGTETRIRNIQVHGGDVRTAYAGQRVAVNLAGVKKSGIRRGDCVCKPDSIRVSMMWDVRLRNLKDSGRVIENGSRVHLYHGSSVLLAKVVLLDRDALSPGESCFAQLRMAEEIAGKTGDRFVVRFYSPLETIGGGVILDDLPKRHKRNDKAVLSALEIKESGSSGERVVQAAAEFKTALPDLKKLSAKLSVQTEELEGEIRDLINLGKLLEPMPGRFAAPSVVDGLWGEAAKLLENYHKQNPLHSGMKAAEMRQKLFSSGDRAAQDALLRELCSEGRLKFVAGHYALADFEIRLTKKQSAIREKVRGIYAEAGIEPPSTDEVRESFPLNERNDLKQVMDSMVSSGELVLLSASLCCSGEAYRRVCSVVCKHFEENETLILAQLRDLLSTSRKFSLAYLEYFDKNKITKKDGDLRYRGVEYAAILDK